MNQPELQPAYKILAILAVLSSLLCRGLAADTVYKNDGGEIKGIVLEDYKDRIVMSTSNGEVEIMKSDIRELYFDDEEKSYIKIAEQARDRGDYGKSYEYYEKALQLNPNSKEAKEGAAFLQEYVYKKEQSLKREFIKKRAESESRMTTGEMFAGLTEAPPRAADLVKESFGMELKENGNALEIVLVERDSPAQKAGLMKNDRLVAVWGKLVPYMPISEVLGLLVKENYVRIECTVERMVEVRRNGSTSILKRGNGALGAYFCIRLGGLTVEDVNADSPAFEAGLKKDDLIVAIDGHSTRYMPLKKAVQLIKDSPQEIASLTIRRDILLLRKEKE
jgi:C-terminal processing protease CtpA/Prc